MKTNNTERSKPQKYTYGSTQVNLPSPLAREIKAFARQHIATAVLVEDGYETNIHITVKYGIKTARPLAALKAALAPLGPITATLGAVAVFEGSPDYDVLHIEVVSADLSKANQAVKAAVDCDDTHPVYKPHVTLAYVEKGKGFDLAGSTAFQGRAVSFDTVVLSAKGGRKTAIALTGDAAVIAKAVGGANQHIVYHQTSLGNARSILKEGFKTGQDLSIGERTGSVYAAHKGAQGSVYAHGAGKAVSVPLNLHGLNLLHTNTLPHDPAKPSYEQEAYKVHQAAENGHIPEGYDGIARHTHDGKKIHEVALRPEVATRSIAHDSLPASLRAVSKALAHTDSPYADHTEMVPISEVKKFREYNRSARPRDGQLEFNALKENIRQNGIKEPLMLDYQHDKKIATLGEGNHRLAAAEELGHTHVPVRVARSYSVEHRPHAKVSGFDMKPRIVNGQEYPAHLPGSMKPSEIGVGVGAKKGIGRLAFVMKAITSHPYADVHEALVAAHGTTLPHQAHGKGAHFVLPDGRMTGDVDVHSEAATAALIKTGRYDPYREDGLQPEDEVMHHAGAARVRINMGGQGVAVEHGEQLTPPQAHTLSTIGASHGGYFRHESSAAPVPNGIMVHRAIHSRGDTYGDFLNSPAVKRVMKSVTKGVDTEARDADGKWTKGGASQTDSPAFKAWFGGSKVVDDQGKPRVAYHGSRHGFDAFDTSSALGSHFGTVEQASHFVRSESTGDRIYPVYLSIQNPLRLTDNAWEVPEKLKDSLERAGVLTGWDEHMASESEKQYNAAMLGDGIPKWRQDQIGKHYPETSPDPAAAKNHLRQFYDTVKSAMQKHGYDGIVYANENEGAGDSYIAFHPHQIKSAIGNNGAFSPHDPDITKGIGRLAFVLRKGVDTEARDADGKWTKGGASQTASPAFKAWFGDSKVVDADGKPLVVYHGTKKAGFDTFQAHQSQDVYRSGEDELPVANSWDMGNDRSGMPHGYHFAALTDAITMGPEHALKMRTGEKERYGLDHPDTNRHIADLERMQGKQVTKHDETRPVEAGHYFTPDETYSFIANSPSVYPVYLSIKNPVYVNSSVIETAGSDFVMEKYRAQGYDGAIFAEDKDNLAKRGWSGATQIVAFGSHQIKSAIGNNGAFSPHDPDITKGIGRLAFVIRKGIDGEPDPKRMAANPDAGKFNEEKINRLHLAHHRFISTGAPQQHGTLGDYLTGSKVRKLHAAVLHTPVFLNQDYRGRQYSALYNHPTKQIHINTEHDFRNTGELKDTLLHEAAHAVRDAKGRAFDIVDGQSDFNGYRNSTHERSARRMANYARLGVDEMNKSVSPAPATAPSQHPFLGVVLPGGHVSDYHAPVSRTEAPSHSLHYQDAGLTGFDSDKSLRFVKNMSRGHYELEGHPALHPDEKASHQQIRALAKHLHENGVPHTTHLVCADHGYSRSQYPHQGHSLGTVGEYAGLGINKGMRRGIGRIGFVLSAILMKHVKVGTIKPGDPHPTKPHLAPSDAATRDIVKQRGHSPVPPSSWGLHVSPDPDADVQATYYDAAGRKQSKYHTDHEKRASDHKYAALHSFHAALPHIRAQVRADLQKPDAHPDRVRAAVVHLMDHTAIRVGAEKYAKENGTYGASSLRKQHISVSDEGSGTHDVKVNFTGKKGKEAEKSVHDAPFHAAVSHLMQQPGDRLFQQRKKDGGLAPVTEKHVNDYLGKFGAHAHQFRTYHGTRIAATHLLEQPHTDDPKVRAQHVTQAMNVVSEHLGNTPEMARKAYVSPEVVHHYMAGTLKPEHAMPVTELS